MSLTTRLLLYFLGTLAVVLVGFSAALYVLATIHLNRQTDDRIDSMLNTLAAAVEVKADHVEWDPGQRHIAFGTRAVGGPVVWMVRDDTGRVIDGSETPDQRDRLAETVAVLGAEGTWLFHERRIQSPGSPGPREKSGGSADRRKHAALAITAGVPLEPVQKSLRLLAAALAGLSLGVWGVAAFAGRAVCRRGLLPVTRMAAAARDMTAADLGPRLPAAGRGDELDDLSRAFNGLLDRLQESFERQRRFTGDASHELRTPLTAMLGQLEVALRRERSAEEYRQVLATVRERAGHLRHIVESLLFLARADADARLPDRERLDLAEWLPAHLREWSAHPRAADIVVEGGGTPVHADVQPAMLGQLLDILIDNACKYSPPGSPVTVRLRGDGPDVSLSVEDKGGGIRDEDVPHLFTPFYRSADARRSGVEGLGLGLSIAKRLADAFAGTLTVRRGQGQLLHAATSRGIRCPACPPYPLRFTVPFGIADRGQPLPSSKKAAQDFRYDVVRIARTINGEGVAMRKGFLGCALVTVAGASLALAQGPSPYYQSAARDGAALPTDVARQAAPVTVDAGRTGPVSSVPPGLVGGGCSNCDTGTAGGNGGCGRDGRFWGSIEYLAWWIKDANVPPLATIGSPNDFNPGAIGQPGTAVIVGGNGIDYDTFSGLRVTEGMWFNDCRTRGIEGNFFFLSQESKNFGAASSGGPGTPVIARPFLDVNSGQPSAAIVAFPGISSGAVSVNTSSRMWGTDTNLLCNLLCSGGNNCDGCGGGRGFRVDGLVGVRYLELREGLGIGATSTVLPTALPILGSTFGNTNLLSFDQFDTYNRFYGGQIGLRSEWWRDRLFVNTVAKVALGDNHQTIDVSGGTSLTPAGPLAAPGGAAIVAPGGLLALASNIGHFTRDRFSVVPELGVNVGYQLTDGISVFVGYTFLYWSNVARPGDQINPVVNSTQLPGSIIPPFGPTAPIFQAHDSDFWAQGVSFGVGVRF